MIRREDFSNDLIQKVISIITLLVPNYNYKDCIARELHISEHDLIQLCKKISTALPEFVFISPDYNAKEVIDLCAENLILFLSQNPISVKRFGVLFAAFIDTNNYEALLLLEQ